MSTHKRTFSSLVLKHLLFFPWQRLQISTPLKTSAFCSLLYYNFEDYSMFDSCGFFQLWWEQQQYLQRYGTWTVELPSSIWPFIVIFTSQQKYFGSAKNLIWIEFFKIQLQLRCCWLYFSLKPVFEFCCELPGGSGIPRSSGTSGCINFGTPPPWKVIFMTWNE